MSTIELRKNAMNYDEIPFDKLEKGDILVETASLNAKTTPIAVIEISNENFDSIIPLLLQSLLGSNKREFLNEDNNFGMFKDKNLMELEVERYD